MVEAKQFVRGDVVMHPRRPEWGEGVVDHAVAIAHEGKAAQRLVIKFTHHGLVTINTGVAPLARKDATTNIMSTTTKERSTPAPGAPGSPDAAPSNGWLGSLGQKPEAELSRLPEAMTDPFASIDRRLQATLDGYRFSMEPRSLIEWGIAQTGLNDPLSKYTRHELEQAFPRFARDRDNALQDLVRLIKKQGRRELIEQALRDTRHPAAKTALQRAGRN